MYELKYALFLSYFSHGFFISLFFSIHVIYIFSCKQNILKLSNFPNGLFGCSFSVSAELIIIFNGYVLTVSVSGCVNMIKYFIEYLCFFSETLMIFICSLSVCVYISVCCGDFSFPYVRIHIIFRTIWIHVSPLSKGKKRNDIFKYIWVVMLGILYMLGKGRMNRKKWIFIQLCGVPWAPNT